MPGYKKSKQERVLILSSDPALHAEISARLAEEERFIPYVASSVMEESLSALRFYLPALIIFDLDLKTPTTQEGMAFLQKVHELCTALLILLVNEEESGKVQELSLKADAYLSKPVNLEDLVRMTERLLNSRGALFSSLFPLRRQRDLIFHIDKDMSLNLSSHQVQVKGRLIDLTFNQFDLFTHLLRNAGDVLTHEEIIAAVWGEGRGSHTLLKNCVWQLRRKLEDNPKRPKYILTRWGIGYYFCQLDGWL